MRGIYHLRGKTCQRLAVRRPYWRLNCAAVLLGFATLTPTYGRHYRQRHFVGWGEQSEPQHSNPELHSRTDRRLAHPTYSSARSRIMRYRRSNVAGGTYFFTVNLANRTHDLLVTQVDTLRAVTRTVRSRHPFEILAWFVLPNHLHSIWTLPPDDTDFPTRWSLIKAGFSRGVERSESIAPSRLRKGERGIWQRRYWEHQIRDDDDLQRHADYIHFNPVKHGFVQRAADWSWSSIHRYIRLGQLSTDWASDSKFVVTGGD